MAKGFMKIGQDILDGIAKQTAEATDSIRHKVVEQGYFGQEQTGYIQNIYGTDFTNTPQSMANTDARFNQLYGTHMPTVTSEADKINSSVSHEINRPNEESTWYHGEPTTRNSSNAESNLAPHNGWELGQDAYETRNESEPNAPAAPPKDIQDWWNSAETSEQEQPEQEM